MFRHYYKSIANSAGEEYRDGAAVPLEWIFLVLYWFVLWGFCPFRYLSGCSSSLSRGFSSELSNLELHTNSRRAPNLIQLSVGIKAFLLL